MWGPYCAQWSFLLKEYVGDITFFALSLDPEFFKVSHAFPLAMSSNSTSLQRLL